MLLWSRQWWTTISASQIRSIGRNAGMPEFLIWQVVHEDIQDKKEPVVITGHKGQSERMRGKAFEKFMHPLQANIHWLFSHKKDHMVNSERQIGLLSPYKMFLYWWTLSTQYTLWWFWLFINDGDVMPKLTFPFGFRINSDTTIKCLEELGLLWVERVAPDRHFVRQQDSATCLISRKTHCCFTFNFYHHIITNI